MEKIYKSGFGPELFIFLLIILGGSASVMILNSAWPGLIIISAVILFILYLFLTTQYTITNEILRVKSAFFYNLKIEVSSIRKIRETNLALSAPAFSLDRLEISYNQSDWVLISPKEKMNFIEELKKLNPAIEVELKKRK